MPCYITTSLNYHPGVHIAEGGCQEVHSRDGVQEGPQAALRTLGLRPGGRARGVLRQEGHHRPGGKAHQIPTYGNPNLGSRILLPPPLKMTQRFRSK